MSALRELYQEVILDHGKTPRNFGKPEHVTSESNGHNPLCGDTVTIYLEVKEGIVEDVGFEGRGCAISIASASMMTEVLRGKSVKEIGAMFKRFHHLVTDDDADTEGGFAGDFGGEDFEKLTVLSGVKEFPMRVKCATLAWHTMQAALKGDDQEVSTE
ncbi:MAG: SUF system NifU family Fe-S cluster assembly protein [Rhodospirillaceae bacterium]|nr:SUF system NifU family Fe-S cluster assembly protein [Rhodospirillaceae bacterium]MBT5677271.1 SUF system NifU family Fe-S cluster assembly protein [Rhodospirillaceae bacterium]MBT5780777.1 SUF system NifU family Fe-S cluster assembly protein [Rhodospirillaceae bacterium]MBT6830925.1 SUF system NifU family Fe-S cluster assembly protein [Rhodospirillaceae bacterium]MBT7291154.1 SUF system NifU family Fe-S cluster assembly protein [Rhodospirillaceae bacterium]